MRLGSLFEGLVLPVAGERSERERQPDLLTPSVLAHEVRQSTSLGEGGKKSYGKNMSAFHVDVQATGSERRFCFQRRRDRNARNEPHCAGVEHPFQGGFLKGTVGSLGWGKLQRRGPKALVFDPASGSGTSVDECRSTLPPSWLTKFANPPPSEREASVGAHALRQKEKAPCESREL